MSTQTLLVPTSTPVNTLVIRLLSPLAELKQLDKPHLDKPISGLSISRTHLLEGCESQKQLLWVGHLRWRGNKRAAPEDSRYPLLTTLAGRREKPSRPTPRLSYKCADQSSTLWHIWPLSFIHSLRFAVSSKGKPASPFLRERRQQSVEHRHYRRRRNSMRILGFSRTQRQGARPVPLSLV